MIVDAQVKRGIVLRRMDAQRRSLLAALVAAGRLAGRHRREQPLRQRLAGRLPEHASRLLDHPRAGQHVARDGEVRLDTVAAPVDAGRTGEGHGLALGTHQVQLPMVASGVGQRQCVEHRLRCITRRQPVHAGLAVQRIHQRLGRQRANGMAGVDAKGPDREEATGDGNAEAAVAVAGED